MMTPSARRVLVTGGAGFIGSHVAEAYLGCGDEVWVVDNLSAGRRENVPEGARFVEMDIRDPDLPRLFEEARFDIVNHHAAQIDVRVSVGDPGMDAAVNIFGLLNLAEAALRTGCRRFIFISSGGVIYGEPDCLPIPETAPKRPLSPYGVSKLTGELYLQYYQQVRGLDYVAMRYSNVYGPRQDPHGEAGVVAIFSQRLMDGEPLEIFGDGEQTRDYVYVGDVVSANMLASEVRPENGSGLDAAAFNVGTGIGTSVNALAGLLESVSGLTARKEYREARAGELLHSALDPSRLKRAGWRPVWELKEGVRETYRSIAGDPV